MKYIDTSVITLTAGYPPSKKGLDFLQSEAKEAIAMLTNQLIGSTYVADTPYSIYGCERSGASSPYDYTAGVVFYNGELYDFPALSAKAISLTDVCVITSTADATADPTELTDGSSVNMHFSRDIVVTDLSAVTNGSASFNFSDMVKLQSDWHVVGATNEPAFKNSWTDNSPTYGKLMFKKQNGFLYIKGRAKEGTGTSGTVVFTLPDEYIPTTYISIKMLKPNAVGIVSQMRITIDPSVNGDITLDEDGTGDSVFDGIIIPLD
tara:strand:+ start:1955 stop:2746 length:792 start_codon:yes stop_codon:yes gene_type:complete